MPQSEMLRFYSYEAQKGISKRACSKDLTLRSQPRITMVENPQRATFHPLFAAYEGCGQHTTAALNTYVK